MGGEDKVPTCTSRILEGRSGTQGNGSGERIATRRGGWAGVTHTTGSQGFPSRINRTKLHPAARGQARASYWLLS